MKLRLTEKDMQLLSFLVKYKIMLASDSKRIYQSKDYHYKRLKVLEKEKYIKRVNKYYIKLDNNGTNLMKELRYEYHNVCRKKEYQKRVKKIIKIASLTLDSTIQFIPSWEIKEQDIFTETARKYIGKMVYNGKNTIAYYIAQDKKIVYIKQVINDIQKIIDCDNIIIFMENLDVLNKYNKYFIFGKESTVIIKPSNINLGRMREFQNIDFYQVLTQIYKDKEIFLSNWKKADYMTDEKDYIFLMPFIDTEKLHRLNIFYQNNRNTNRKIDIITLRENKEKIQEILINSTNIIELDNWLGGVEEKCKES